MRDLGTLRRSSVISTYGPGSIADFRSGSGGSAAISVIMPGIEAWDETSAAKGISNFQTIFEPRLQKKLSVDGFRLPPVLPEGTSRYGELPVAAVRFPKWLQCPKCDLLKIASKWSHEPGDPARYCAQCSDGLPHSERVYVVPVRFVAACEDGHIEDFPWNRWVGHKPSCSANNPLKLRSIGAGLSGLVLSCTECGSSRSMQGAFAKTALSSLGCSCSGNRPWLSTNDSECNKTIRALQRGASNIYFPVIHSAIDIPPWSDRLQKSMGQYWAPLVSIEDPAQREIVLKALLPQLPNLGWSADDLPRELSKRIEHIKNIDPEDLRWDEYCQFCDSSIGSDHGEFEIHHELVPDEIKHVISLAVRVTRLREVRAISGFTRIHPHITEVTVDDGAVSSVVSPISESDLRWLPAIENRGEGIFLRLNEALLKTWECNKAVRAKTQQINQARSIEIEQRLGNPPADEIPPRFMLLHSFAHALMRELALECGYSSASLRERIYSSSVPNKEMAGILIFTASPDSDGTLGGLERQGVTDRISLMIKRSINAMRWCSSDPLCITGVTSSSEPLNLAACHSCLYAPETSCEEFNKYLAREFLVGTPEDITIGYFSSLLD